MRNYKILPFVRQNFGMAAATPVCDETVTASQKTNWNQVKMKVYIQIIHESYTLVLTNRVIYDRVQERNSKLIRL